MGKVTCRAKIKEELEIALELLEGLEALVNTGRAEEPRFVWRYLQQDIDAAIDEVRNALFAVRGGE